MRSLAYALAALITATTVATAAEAPSRGAMLKACGDDLRRFCASVSPGGGRIRDCMTAHLTELKPECRAIVETAGKKQ